MIRTMALLWYVVSCAAHAQPALPLESIVLPPDVLVAPDGSLRVSDDAAGAIYRIRYRG